MDIGMTVERIKALSKTKGIKMKFLCSTLGVRENYFNDCKNKQLSIPEELIQKIAVVLETTPEYILGQTDNPIPHSDQIKEYLPYEKRGNV